MAKGNRSKNTKKAFKLPKDPVSGNEVPIGSTPTEVRDNVPAMLSPGEYVIPADVVKFHGVKFFEDMTKQAKEGFVSMRGKGRVGGAPSEQQPQDSLPFSDKELFGGGYVGLAAGGVVDPTYTLPTEIPTSNTPAAGTTPASGTTPVDASGLTYKTYYDSSGNSIQVPFMNGQPLGVVPAGYSEVSPTQAGHGGPPGADGTQTGDIQAGLSTLSAAELQSKLDKPMFSDTTTGKFVAAALGPLGRMALTAAEKFNRDNIQNYYDKAVAREKAAGTTPTVSHTSVAHSTPSTPTPPDSSAGYNGGNGIHSATGDGSNEATPSASPSASDNYGWGHSSTGEFGGAGGNDPGSTGGSSSGYSAPSEGDYGGGGSSGSSSGGSGNYGGPSQGDNGNQGDGMGNGPGGH